MPDGKEKDDQAVGKEQTREEAEQENAADHHIPAPPKKKKHRKNHWEHLPGSKRKPIRSYKSPGRK